MEIIIWTNFSHFTRNLFNIALHKQACFCWRLLIARLGRIYFNSDLLPPFWRRASWIGKFSNITSFSVNSRSRANMYPPGGATSALTSGKFTRAYYIYTLTRTPEMHTPRYTVVDTNGYGYVPVIRRSTWKPLLFYLAKRHRPSVATRLSRASQWFFITSEGRSS